MKKQLITLIVLLLPMLASAYDAQIDGIYYIFNTTEKTATVTASSSNTSAYSGVLIIPDVVTYNGETYNVTSIDQDAFWYCSELTSVTIPNSVISISSGAFTGCSGLTTVTIPQSVTSIRSLVFQNCSSLTSVTILCSPINIGSNIFVGCNNLKEAVFDSETITPILAGVSSLEKVTIKDSSTSIGKNAFYGCKGITSVTIPNSVTSIGEGAFYGCSGITSLALSNNLISIDKYAFAECTGLQSVTIPNSVTSIGEGAFSNCSGTSSLTIGSGVTSIGSDAFVTINLKKTIWLTNTPPAGYANVHSTINYVSNDQFRSLSNVIIYSFLSSMFEVDGIKYVPVSPSERTCDAIDCLFDEGVANVTIASTVSYKGVAMKIKNIQPYFAYDNNCIKNLTVDFEGAIAHNAFNNCTNIKTLKIREEVTNIGSQAFFNCSSLESIIIPDAVTKIGTNVFSGCTGMLSAKIGNGLTAIEVATFSGCSSLNELIIGSQVKEIKVSAFENCIALPTITIPKNVINVDNYVFKGCTNLKCFIVADREEELTLGSNYNNPLFAFCPLDSVFIGGNISYDTSSNFRYSPFYGNKSLRAIHITGKETVITENEFNGCTNLKNVRIGDGVKSIGNWAFSGCSSLDFFSFGYSMESIGKEAFSDCTNVTKIISRASIPPTCGSQALDDINKWNCTLTVPKNWLANYQAADQWKEFFFIVESEDIVMFIGDANSDGTVNVMDIVDIVTHTMGKPTSTGKFNEKAADANGDGMINAADVVKLVNIIAGQ